RTSGPSTRARARRAARAASRCAGWWSGRAARTSAGAASGDAVLSLPELARAVALVDRALRGARVERVVQVDDRRLVVSLRTPGGEDAHLLLCADPASARLSRLPRRPAAPPAPPPFAQLLRARLAGARLTGARIVDDDRQAALRFAGPEGEYELLLSLLGPRS